MRVEAHWADGRGEATALHLRSAQVANCTGSALLIDFAVAGRRSRQCPPPGMPAGARASGPHVEVCPTRNARAQRSGRFPRFSCVANESRGASSGRGSRVVLIDPTAPKDWVPAVSRVAVLTLRTLKRQKLAAPAFAGTFDRSA